MSRNLRYDAVMAKSAPAFEVTCPCVQAPRLVDAGRSLPIDNVNQVPRVPNKIHLQVAVLIDHELGCRVQDARALAFVRVVQIKFSSRQIVGGRSGVPVHLTESEEAVSDKANLPSSWGWNHSDVTAVIPQSARDLNVPRGFHLAERVDQPLILAFLECLYQYLLVCRSRVIINVQRDADLRSHLSASAHGASINRLRLVSGKTGSASYHEQTCNQQTGEGKLLTSWTCVLGL